MAEVTTTTAAVFIPELWSEAILDYAEREFRLVNQVTDLSASVPNGDILHIPKVSEETAATLSSGSAVSYGANTDSEIQLSVNQHVQWAFSQATMIIIIEELSGKPKYQFNIDIWQSEPKDIQRIFRGRAQMLKRYNTSKSPQLLTEQNRYADTQRKL